MVVREMRGLRAPGYKHWMFGSEVGSTLSRGDQPFICVLDPPDSANSDSPPSSLIFKAGHPTKIIYLDGANTQTSAATGILTSLTSKTSSPPSPFSRESIKVYEEPRLREQDFGNFQPCSAEMERMWHERADYGHFFYRIPNGESAADAYDRVSGFNESLWRQFGDDDFASICVLVTHGLMTRIFLMKWYHYSVEHFEDLRNINHCEFIVMKLNSDSGKYILQNKMRTWTELKRERAIAEGRHLDTKPEEASASPRRKWGGCPLGCDHAKYKPPFRRRRENTAEFGQKDINILEKTELNHKQLSGKSARDSIDLVYTQSPELSDDPRGRTGAPRLISGKVEENAVPNHLGIDPYFKRLDSPYRLSVHQVGRDFGGSRSGVASRDGSHSSGSDHEDEHRRDEKDAFSRSLDKGLGAVVDALEDRRSAGGRDRNGELEAAEATDKSLYGSVY
ncbi:hypothetical protein GP486_000540 [Trichoglossum hirsutum]|uniref:Phosphoglycerate mutase n=1 Tax=Trichoglossum hirsutum TaxID=265104 RepID=A0A9P8LIM0_9PEZI|nr:hypothetical protein GP486_000540 [Trichoglossum hirsutum]